MARHLFGGDVAVVNETGDVLFGVTGTVWTAETAGTQLTDLLDVNGTPSILISTDTNGKYHFSGPDGVSEVWVDFGRGRWRTSSADVVTRVTSLEQTSVTTAIVAVPNGLATLDSNGQLAASQRSLETQTAIADLQSTVSDLQTRMATLELEPRLVAQSTAPTHGAINEDVWVDST